MTPFEEQLVEHRVYLIRFARLQLRNNDWAEDAVSETLLAALSKPQSFGNRSQLKTWLVGILKHKVIDLTTKAMNLIDCRSMQMATLRKCPTIGVIQTKPCSRHNSFRCLMPAWNACRLPWAACS